jgi:hypothetical protein
MSLERAVAIKIMKINKIKNPKVAMMKKRKKKKNSKTSCLIMKFSMIKISKRYRQAKLPINP